MLYFCTNCTHYTSYVLTIPTVLKYVYTLHWFSLNNFLYLGLAFVELPPWSRVDYSFFGLGHGVAHWEALRKGPLAEGPGGRGEGVHMNTYA